MHTFTCTKNICSAFNFNSNMFGISNNFHEAPVKLIDEFYIKHVAKTLDTEFRKPTVFLFVEFYSTLRNFKVRQSGKKIKNELGPKMYNVSV